MIKITASQIENLEGRYKARTREIFRKELARRCTELRLGQLTEFTIALNRDIQLDKENHLISLAALIGDIDEGVEAQFEREDLRAIRETDLLQPGQKLFSIREKLQQLSKLEVSSDG